jgi:hypothetical protein
VLGSSTVTVTDLAGDPGDRARTVRVLSTDPADPSTAHVDIVAVGSDRGVPFVWSRRAILSRSPVLSGTVPFDGLPLDMFAELVGLVDCTDGRWSHRGAPVPFDRDLLAAMIGDPQRRLPVVGVLAGSGLDPEVLAGQLVGLAHVVDVGRRHAECEADLGVGAAGAVLWWPGWPAPRTRQWWAPDALVDRFGAGLPLVRTIVAASAFRIPAPPVLDRAAAATARRRLADARASATLDDTALAEWEADLVALEEARERLDEASAELAAARADNDALLAAWDATVAAATEAYRSAASTPLFASVSDVLRFADEHLEHLEVSPEAFAAADGSPYRWPERLAAALQVLDELVRAWRVDDLPGGFSLAATSAGLPWRADVGELAANRFGADYAATRRDGTTVQCGPHLAWGANTGPAGHLRCYLFIDRDSRTVVVGPTGRHGRDRHNR